MQHIPWNGDMAEFPEPLRRYLRPGHVFDSSSSAEATVYYSDIGQGCYIKKARHGALRNEAAMTRYFHDKGLAAAVLHYGQDHDSNDWLATACLPGDDCTASLYVREPERLAAVLGRRLRMLHEQDPTGCPVSNRTKDYLAAVERNHAQGCADRSFFTRVYGNADTESIYRLVRQHGDELHHDTLLHGDYCLPNVILDDWRFSGFVDLDCAGVGDRHVDVYWALWTLWFNLHTDAYGDHLLDAYGRDLIDMETLRLVAACEVFG